MSGNYSSFVRRIVCVVAAIMCAIASKPVRARQVPDTSHMPAGGAEMFRVTTAGGARYTGLLNRVVGDSLTMSTPNGMRSFRYSELTALQVRDGERHPVFEGMGIGTLTGMLIGAAIGWGTSESCGSGDFCILDRSDMAAIGGIGGGAIGLVLGTVIGATTTVPRWRMVMLPAGNAGVMVGGVLRTSR